MISLLSKGLSSVFSSTTVQKHEFFSVQPSLWSSSHREKRREYLRQLKLTPLQFVGQKLEVRCQRVPPLARGSGRSLPTPSASGAPVPPRLVATSPQSLPLSPWGSSSVSFGGTCHWVERCLSHQDDLHLRFSCNSIRTHAGSQGRDAGVS